MYDFFNLETQSIEKNFFCKNASNVAKDLLAVVVFFSATSREYIIVETEAYHAEDKDRQGKSICYGAKGPTQASAPLFKTPGTWCIYGGQLLLSVNSSNQADNVLIKAIIDENGEIITSDGIAKEFHLYQKDDNSIYWQCHGSFSLCYESLKIIGKKQGNFNIKSKPRVRINDSSEENYYIDLA